VNNQIGSLFPFLRTRPFAGGGSLFLRGVLFQFAGLNVGFRLLALEACNFIF